MDNDHPSFITAQTKKCNDGGTLDFPWGICRSVRNKVKLNYNLFLIA